MTAIEKRQYGEETSSDVEKQVHPPLARMSLTRRLGHLAATFLLACLLFITTGSPRSTAPFSIEHRVDTILSTTPLIDGHDDLPIFIRARFNNQIYGDNFTIPFTKGNLTGHVDLPRLSQGKVGGTFWSVFVSCPKNWTNFSDATYTTSVRQTMEQVDVMSRLAKAYPDTFSPPPNGTTALQAFQDGKIISPMGIEGLHSIGNSFALLRNFYQLGVSYATLTHNCHNRYADAALAELPTGGVKIADPHWHGVSEAGKKVVYEMNRLGMIVDLAHVSVDTMRDVLGAGKDEWTGSRAPVIFSHSSARAICPHPRNVPDDVLELVKAKDSLVMINFSPDFISCTASDNPSELPKTDLAHATLDKVADHIMHIGGLIGFDHVGLGSDFDGIPTVPQGLEDVSKFPNLVAELLRRGVSDEDAAKVVGGNLLRVWKRVDEVALQMQEQGAVPAEDKLE
ncbi:putative dipeptidase [Aspergillus clavatus NRRL 1]|uniref:Dipeptidase n=1 Tax=Aspergillus clavatus (strain ATCC 1007 / CBS 513.65 / DSM 816 / NCTC 3887 / NRRL 1 / QM 1276 / 107) TaxID=344612 RepID=A1CU35_ASPCL|nr:dipeptidase [Aspergillus clavatus NRRL 1]EAW06822.1 dipeptidase [Aspergillus clavatus NRRL 1]